MTIPTLHQVSVAVASVWASPEAPRAVDRPALMAPVRMHAWLTALDETHRLELCSRKLLDTQVLFGEKVHVIATSGEWCQVVIPGQASRKDPRGYPGWIPHAQLMPIEAVPDSHDRFVMVTAPTAPLHGVDDAFEPLTLSFLTRLPLIGEHGDMLEVATPLGSGRLARSAVAFDTGMPRQHTVAEMIALGERFLGLPYLWSGRSGFGFDCSGFMHALFKASGRTIPRDAIDQAQAGLPVALDALAPGDLLFFERPQADGHLRIEHVGLYCGNGEMLHSPTSGQSIEYRRLAGSQYAHELCAARRYLPDDAAGP